MRRVLVGLALLSVLGTTAVDARAAGSSYDVSCTEPGTGTVGSCSWVQTPGSKVFSVVGTMTSAPLMTSTVTAQWSSPWATPPARGPQLEMTYQFAGLDPVAGAKQLRIEARWRSERGRWSPWMPVRTGSGNVGFGSSAPGQAGWSARPVRGQRIAWEWQLVGTIADPQHFSFDVDLTHHTG
jgi:hypothetical protein